MATSLIKTQNGITIKVKIYNNCDNVQICWRTLDSNNFDKPIPECIGFKIERQRLVDNAWKGIEVLRNRVGFDSEIVDSNDFKDISKPSSKRPFQRYDWTDHGANANEIVRYRISALKKTTTTILGNDDLLEIIDSGWSEQITMTPKVGDRMSVYFNRGTVMSQYIARVARENNWNPVDIKNHIEDIQEPLRMFLSGELRVALVKILDDAIANPFIKIYAALYELSDDELIGKLVKLKSRANVVLSDGSNETDGNARSRKKLKDAKVNVFDRMVKKEKKSLGHNKFLISVDSRDEKPLLAWTGSTNWAATGLCTQLNNGLLIEDSEIAGVYHEQWKRLRDAGSDYPSSLVNANSNSPYKIKNVDIWFTRVKSASAGNTETTDIAGLKKLVSEAKHSILYIMFQPGSEPLKSIIERRNDLYVRGVVSTLLGGNKEKFKLMNSVNSTPYTLDLIQPDGIHKNLKWWTKEVIRNEFLMSINPKGIGHAITHIKMIVIDPFSDDCKVITGSHNFSNAASEANDENFIIIKRNRILAEYYAVESISIYNHYRWRAYLTEKYGEGKDQFEHLSDKAEWQNLYLSNPRTLKHIKVWC